MLADSFCPLFRPTSASSVATGAGCGPPAQQQDPVQTTALDPEARAEGRASPPARSCFVAQGNHTNRHHLCFTPEENRLKLGDAKYFPKTAEFRKLQHRDLNPGLFGSFQFLQPKAAGLPGHARPCADKCSSEQGAGAEVRSSVRWKE